MPQATGSFEVKLMPQPGDDPALGRLTVGKQIHGDFDGTSKGEMLTAMTSVKTSGAYVAVERLTGTLHGRSGSFVVVHRGFMSGGDQQLEIVIVTDSGTDALAGISGTMAIKIDAAGKHTYEIDYALSD